MRFRTEISIPATKQFILDPAMPCAMAGSCFTQNMARMMRRSLWNAVAPFGTLYNPASIQKLLEIIMAEEDNCEEIRKSLFVDHGLWHSYLLDSSFSSDESEGVVNNFLNAASDFRKALDIGRQLIITFGTSWVYDIKETGETVANCHKLSSTKFVRRRLSVEEIVEMWRDPLNKLYEFYPTLKIVFTVSPVRHLKDGFIGNTLSKAILNLSVEAISNEFSGVSWFPAYEILMDDLRDYRFYSSDLVHPSEQAVEYVWEKFKETYLNPEGIRYLDEGERLRKSLDHRMLINTPAKEKEYEEFRNKVAERLSDFLRRFPNALDPTQ